jgi:hypothetical protein
MTATLAYGWFLFFLYPFTIYPHSFTFTISFATLTGEDITDLNTYTLQCIYPTPDITAHTFVRL